MIIGIDSSRAFIAHKTGTENYSFNLIKAIVRLPESRAHTFVLFTRPNAILPSELVGYSNIVIKQVRWSYLWTQIGLAWATWGKFSNSQIDILWVPAHTLPVLRNPRIPTVVTIHGLEYQWLPEYKNILQKWYLPLSTFYAAKYATTLIAVSQFTANQLVKELHTDKKKIKVIHEGVEIDNRSSIVDGRNILDKYGLCHKKYILFVGTVQPRKNLVALIEAFAQIASDIPDCKLVVAGGIGWMADEVLRAPGKYGIQEKVVFTGRVSDLELQSLYLGALMYVQPSITEGFGLPILEAMGYGIPVISSDGGALREVAHDAAIIVPLASNFVDELAKNIYKLASQSQLRAKMIVAGKKRVTDLSWNNAAKKTLNTLITTGRKNS